MAAVLSIADRATDVSVSVSGDANATARSGTLISQTYRVGERLGSGGMGDVYEVEHVRLGRTFAAKFLNERLRSNPSAVARFEGEARALSRVRSAHVVGIVDCGNDSEGVPFFVMERLFGADLRSILTRHGPLPVPRACGLLIGAAAGLKAMHAAGLAHGDVKPGNLFVCLDDFEGETCKLLDLGLARSVADGEVARSQHVAGTIRYMAPEQLANGNVADERTDIYALGAVLYECLCGSPPHDHECVERTMYAIMHSPPAPFAARHVTVPVELEEAVFRALSPDASSRFAGAEAFIDALAPFARGMQRPRVGTWAHADDATGEVRDSSIPSAPPRRRSARLTFAAGIGLGASLALVALILSRAAGITSPQRRAALAVPQREASTESSPRLEAPSPTISVAAATAAGTAAATRSGNPESSKPPAPRSQRPNQHTPFSTVVGVFDRDSPYDAERHAP
jgi:serine/threonine protein kinase